MGALVTRRARTRQPQQLAGIERNPLTRGLALAINPAVGNLDVAAARAAASAGGVSRVGALRGVGLLAASNTSVGMRFANSPLYTSTGDGKGDFTVLIIAAPKPSSAREIIYCTQNGAQEFYLCANTAIAGSATTAGRFSAFSNAGGASGVEVDGYLDGNPHVFAYTRSNAVGGGSATGTLYIDGKIAGSSGNVIPAQIWSSASSDYIGGYSSGSWGVSGAVTLVLGWNRILSAQEIAEVSRNPWQVFKAPRRRLWLAYSASVTTSVSASLSWAEADDGSAIAATETDRDTIAWTESDDAFTVAGTVTNRAAVVWSEPDDAYTTLVTETDSESFAWSEPDDVCAVATSIINRSSIAWTEVDDAESIAATEATPTNVSGSLAWMEQDDGFAAFMTAATGGAPGYGDASKRKYVVRKGDQLYTFKRPEDAQAFLHADDEPTPVKQYPAKKQAKVKAPEPVPKPRPEPAPEQRVDLAEIQALAAKQHAEAEYQQALARQQYETLLTLLERLREEEEDDWLLMAAE
jgi:hypothetical protein